MISKSSQPTGVVRLTPMAGGNRRQALTREILLARRLLKQFQAGRRVALWENAGEPELTRGPRLGQPVSRPGPSGRS